MDSRDAREGLERGGGDARCTCSSAQRKVAAVFITQILLTAICAAFSLCIFFQIFGSNKQQDKGIYLEMVAVEELKFHVIWNQSVDLKHEKKVVLSCGGPYMVYMWACVRSYNAAESKSVNMTLQQRSKSVYQQTMPGRETTLCHETQSIVMLSEKSEVTIKLEQINAEIESLHLGFYYMLGAQCFSSKIEAP